MSSHNSRPTDGQNEHQNDTVRHEHGRPSAAVQPDPSGSPVPEQLDDLQEAQSRLTLGGDAYEAFGNDGDHKSPNVRSNEPTPGNALQADATNEDAYGRESSPERRTGSERRDRAGSAEADERLRERVCERLTQHHLADISDVSIEVSNGCVTLKGTIPDQRMNAMIEEVVGNCPNVQTVTNHIEVDAGRAGHGNTGG